MMMQNGYSMTKQKNYTITKDDMEMIRENTEYCPRFDFVSDKNNTNLGSFVLKDIQEGKTFSFDVPYSGE